MPNSVYFNTRNHIVLMSIMGLCFHTIKMLALKPLPGRCLVEIREKYSHVATTEQKYDTKTSGICVNAKSMNIEWLKLDPALARTLMEGLLENLQGKLVFWEEYKEGQIIERDGKKYAFIKIEDLDGYEDV